MKTHLTRCAWLAGLAVIAVIVGACTTPGVVRLSGDAYRVSRADPGGIADTAAMKSAAVADADAFARSRGMVAVPVATHEDTLRFGHLTTVDYDFRLVAQAEPSTAATAAATAPIVATPVATERAVASPEPAPPAARSQARRDYYDELLRLDDLRKRGILTEDEFQTLKAKIIADK